MGSLGPQPCLVQEVHPWACTCPHREGKEEETGVRRLASRLLGRGRGQLSAPSQIMLCHWQRDWVWGPGGYGAILLVNCDRDNLNCYDQDNRDQQVRCLQGKGVPRVTAQLPRRSHWREHRGPEFQLPDTL